MYGGTELYTVWQPQCLCAQRILKLCNLKLQQQALLDVFLPLWVPPFTGHVLLLLCILIHHMLALLYSANRQCMTGCAEVPGGDLFCPWQGQAVCIVRCEGSAPNLLFLVVQGLTETL